MESFEMTRRAKRIFDTNSLSYRRIFIVSLIIFGLIWLFGLRFLSTTQYRIGVEPVDCLTRKLQRLQIEVDEMDTAIMHVPLEPDDKPYLPYIGNGYIGISLTDDDLLSIKPKSGRTLSAHLPFRPLVRVSTSDEVSRQEAIVSQYKQGVVQTILCLDNGFESPLEVNIRYYAHRTHPSIFEQHIFIRNPNKEDITVHFQQIGYDVGDSQFKTYSRKVQQSDGEMVEFINGVGMILIDKIYTAFTISTRKIPNSVEIKSKSSTTLRFISVINYSFLENSSDFEKTQNKLITKSESDLKRALLINVHKFQSLHENAWKDLWTIGFYLSSSRAQGALNGDKINATMYYVLSQVRSPLYEINVPQLQITEANAVLSYAEGCYGGHNTLQAPSLWSSLQSESDIISVANLWLLTLEKMGCHNLLKAGAGGVIQGMVLSFGALKFSNQHLEFNTEPKDLHRDYLFRRIWYGNSTHLNISVAVGKDNKAVISAALDRSDKDYYACDAGCLDTPVQLGPKKKNFPVKLTDPVTSVLYITSDRVHVEELRLSIHVKEVFEAPAHKNMVINMHKHGSNYGTMSTMFWISISFLIIAFHIFLFHLVYTEYFGNQEKFRSRKVSDF